MDTIRYVKNEKSGEGGRPIKAYGVETARRVRAFHALFPEYRVTPLVQLAGLARELGLDSESRILCISTEGGHRPRQLPAHHLGWGLSHHINKLNYRKPKEANRCLTSLGFLLLD